MKIFWGGGVASPRLGLIGLHDTQHAAAAARHQLRHETAHTQTFLSYTVTPCRTGR